MPNARSLRFLAATLSLFLLGCSHENPATTPLGRDADDPPATTAVSLLEDFSNRQMFPVDNWWNQDVSMAPLDGNSAAIIHWINNTTPADPNRRQRLHPDFGPPPYGIPYVGVDGTQPRVTVTFTLYGSQSDAGAPGFPTGYPIPLECRTQPNYIEGGVIGGGSSGDRHMLIIDRDNNLLFETWATRWNAALSRWEAGSGAIFDMDTNNRRPDGWTSADAAGLAIFPGLIRRDELVAAGEIEHAFRFTTRATNGYVWPASHEAGNDPAAPPMGTRLRMKAGKVITGYTPELQKIFRAMKKYGLILADNGTDMYIQGTMDPGWDNDILNPAFHGLYADDFEVIELGWQPATTGVPEF